MTQITGPELLARALANGGVIVVGGTGTRYWGACDFYGNIHGHADIGQAQAQRPEAVSVICSAGR